MLQVSLQDLLQLIGEQQVELRLKDETIRLQVVRIEELSSELTELKGPDEEENEEE